MNTAFTRTAALLVLCLALAASAQDMNVGIAKFQGGDYSGALQDLVPFAEQDHALAQTNLGVLYTTGLGVEPDAGQAVAWYRLAAEQGYAAAQFSLGLAYYNGDGVPRDPVLAYAWSNVAAANGHQDAAGVRYQIAEQISASDLVTAQQIAQQCREQGYEYCVR